MEKEEHVLDTKGLELSDASKWWDDKDVADTALENIISALSVEVDQDFLELITELKVKQGIPHFCEEFFRRYNMHLASGKFERELRSSAIYWHMLVLACFLLYNKQQTTI